MACSKHVGYRTLRLQDIYLCLRLWALASFFSEEKRRSKTCKRVEARLAHHSSTASREHPPLHPPELGQHLSLPQLHCRKMRRLATSTRPSLGSGARSLLEGGKGVGGALEEGLEDVVELDVGEVGHHSVGAFAIEVLILC